MAAFTISDVKWLFGSANHAEPVPGQLRRACSTEGGKSLRIRLSSGVSDDCTITVDGVSVTNRSQVRGVSLGLLWVTCDVPAHAAGDVDLVVTNPVADGGESQTWPFRYDAAPLVTLSSYREHATTPVTVTITASRASTIYYLRWPGEWAHTAAGQTVVDVEVSETGPLCAFAVGDGDGLYSDYVTGDFVVNRAGYPKRVYDSLWYPDHWGVNLESFAGTRWTVKPDGDTGPVVWAATNAAELQVCGPGSILPVGSYPNFSGIALWNADTLHDDQCVYAAHAPPMETADSFIMARMSEDGLSGYGAEMIYYNAGPPYGEFRINRYNNGVITQSWNAGPNVDGKDGDECFYYIKVIGHDPVRIEVGTYVPDTWVGDAYFQTNRDADGDGTSDQLKFPNFGSGTRCWPRRGVTGWNWVYGTVEDNSAQQIRTGARAGMRVGTTYGFAKFFAEEVPTVALPSLLTVPYVSATTGTISGSEVALDAGEYVEWIVDAGSGGTFRLDYTTIGAGSIAATADGGTIDPASFVLGPGTHTIRLTAVGGTVTVSDVGAFSITDSATTDTSTSADSNTTEVISPSSVAVSDGTSSTDSTTCVLVRPATVSAPFLLAASILFAVFYDTANADTGSSSDSVVIASTTRNTDSSTQADANAIRLDVPISDTTTSSDVVGSVVGVYSVTPDTTTSEDAVGVELVIRTGATDATTSADSVGLEFISPEAIAVVDSTVSTDSNASAVSIGHADVTTSSDAANGYVGLLSNCTDGTTSEDASSVSVSAAPPSDAVPHAAIADPIIVGVVAEENRAGMRADPIAVGLLYGSVMKLGKCYQGCDFPIFFPKVKDANGDEVDLSGASLRCYALVDGSPVGASSTSVDAVKGTAQATFSATQTNVLVPGTIYNFDGVVTLANGLEYAIGTGSFKVYDPITPTP